MADYLNYRFFHLGWLISAKILEAKTIIKFRKRIDKKETVKVYLNSR